MAIPDGIVTTGSIINTPIIMPMIPNILSIFPTRNPPQFRCITKTLENQYVSRNKTNKSINICIKK